MEVSEIASRFRMRGTFSGASAVGEGHINETYIVSFDGPSGLRRLCVQRINTSVFRDVPALMENFERVTSHLRGKVLARGSDPAREAVTLVPARDGAAFVEAEDGSFWRAYVFIDGAETFQRAEEPRIARAAARKFADFHKDLADLPGERLKETIPRFHDTRSRLTAFMDAVREDPRGRVKDVRAEIDAVLKRERDVPVIVDLLDEGALPERITHNDTKLNNVLFDEKTGEPLCLIDLDTVMPGSVLYDFGDAVRLGAASAAEDETDLSKVSLSLTAFEAFVQGYLESAREFLVPAEIEHLAFSAKLMTLELGIRFLTDHLLGDVYFRVRRPGQNLDRCRRQLRMVGDMESKSGEMRRIVERLA